MISKPTYKFKIMETQNWEKSWQFLKKISPKYGSDTEIKKKAVLQKKKKFESLQKK
jgi:hypothetical protein